VRFQAVRKRRSPWSRHYSSYVACITWLVLHAMSNASGMPGVTWATTATSSPVIILLLICRSLPESRCLGVTRYVGDALERVQPSRRLFERPLGRLKRKLGLV
jgi:hypothetical protein